jgi:hypothetical protein
MLRHAVIIGAALSLVGSAPIAAARQQDLRMPDTRDAAEASGHHPPPPSSFAATAERQYRDLRSPDARDAGAGRGLYDQEPPAPVSVVQVRDVGGSGFDWGDAAIGAAAMVALFSIACGAALLVTARRRRRPIQAVTH